MTLPPERVDALVGDRPVFDYDRRTELSILRRLDDLVPPRGVFWDVGAHAGLYAVVAAQVHPEATVCCVEASPHTRETRLAESVAGLENVAVLPFGLADAPGREPFLETAPGSTDNALASTDGTPEDHERTTVRVESARSAVDGGHAPPPDVLKVDVEGAEGRVLRGFDAALLDGVETLLVELHHYGGTAGAATDLLEAHGFALESLGTRGDEGRRTEHVLATRPD